MNDFVFAVFFGFLVGFVSTPFAVLSYADLDVSSIRAAEAICVKANSELVSLDRNTATCKNQAEIPYKVKP